MLLPAVITAQDQKILSVKVRGNVRVPTSIILGKIKTQEGQEFSSQVVQEDVRTLWQMEDFTDIKVEKNEKADGIELIFRVSEKYAISKITFAGNRAFRDKTLKKQLDSSEGNLFDRKKLKEDEEKLISFYREAGFAKIGVSSEIDEKEEKREVSMTFRIDEGTAAWVAKFSVEGNKVLSDRKIRKQIKTRPSLFRRKLFREDTLNEDKQRILSLYRNHGYIKATISDAEVVYDKKGKKAYVTIYIDEGPEYTVGAVKLKDELKKEIKLREGLPFSPEELRKDIGRVYDYLYARGYVYASVNAAKRIDEEKKKVDLTYVVDEKDVVYIEEIKISGNQRTKDKIIRREILIKPGDRFDLNKIRSSQRKISNLGTRQPFFEKVTFDIQEGSAPDKKNLHFKLTEGKTGTVLFGGGYSSREEFIGFIEVDIENFDIGNVPTFGGGGQSISVYAETGTESESYSFSFTEPWLFDIPLSSGFDIYDRLWEWDDYDEDRTGGRLRLGYALGEFNSIHTRYKHEDVDISDLSEDASEEIANEEGTNTISSLSLIFSRDTRDNVFDPKHGGKSSISTELAGSFLSGDTNFTKYIGKTSWFFPVWKNTSINLRMQLGLVQEFGDSEYVPFYERFYIGGADSIRGYPYRDIGPKDENDEPIGGGVKAQANIEYIIPIVKELKGAVFFDTGNVWSSTDEFDLADLYSGVGVGIRLTTPMGLLRLDYGYGIDIGEGRIHFTIGWPY